MTGVRGRRLAGLLCLVLYFIMKHIIHGFNDDPHPEGFGGLSALLCSRLFVRRSAYQSLETRDEHVRLIEFIPAYIC